MSSIQSPLFDRVAIIGIGLIGSSLARGIRRGGLARAVVCCDASAEACATALALGVVDAASTDLATAVDGADLVVLATPVGTYAALAEPLAALLKPGVVVTDVGSVKQTALRDLAPAIPEGVHFIPGHPIAGTEFSGPAAGFAELFDGRWCILTPPPGSDSAVVDRLVQLWEGCGSKVEVMEPAHHDQVLAITSHLPHLIAYTIVGTAADMEETSQSEVIKFSASGFRDFTRIAASDPVMWRDIFMNNKEAVLEVLQRFTEDLTALQRAIRWGEADKLHDHFAKTRAIRRAIIDAKQA